MFTSQTLHLRHPFSSLLPNSAIAMPIRGLL
jgi:hypothetical protein